MLQRPNENPDPRSLIGLNYIGELQKEVYRCGWFDALELLHRMRVHSKVRESILHQFVDLKDGSHSTRYIREICEPFGRYWSDIKHANMVDGIDTAHCHLKI